MGSKCCKCTSDKGASAQRSVSTYSYPKSRWRGRMLGNGTNGSDDIVVNNHHGWIGSNTTAPAGGRPQLARRLSDLSVKVGTRTRFLVEVISSTPVTVKWEKDGIAVEEDDHVRLVTEGQFHCIDISPVTLEDSGVWRVRVTNTFGATTSAAQLSLIVPKAYKEPEFVEPLRAVLTAQGTVSLECKVVGVPTPGLRWFKGDSEIKAGDVLALSHPQTDPSSLGTYTCLATNCMGSAKSTSIVHIDGAPIAGESFLPTGPKPVFIRELRNERVKIGTTMALECKVNVPPWPEQVSWYSPKGEAVESERIHLMEDGAGIYSLRINSVSAEDNGQWKCVATSKQGVKSMSTCTVSVNFPKNYRKPKFLESLKAILTEEGLVSFECKVVGYPTPHLSWFKDGQELKPGDVYQLTGTNSLGSYCCIARNCMGEAESSAELTLEDIKSQLSEEERLQLTSEQLPPRFIQGLKSAEVKITESHKFTVQVSVFPEPTVLWFRDEEIIENNDRIKLEKEKLGFYHLTINKLEFPDQAEWKCVATNDFGQSITSCFLKLNIPRHYKKPKFLEDLKAVLSEEGAVNLECKVIGVPQPKLKWYKDGKELKAGDIHRIISGQDGTCCLGTYTCLAHNCMGTVSSSASLLGFEDKGQKIPAGAAEVAGRGQVLTHDRSLSTIHEERTSQLHDTDKSTTIDDRAEEISFSFDGKEVSVSLYETPDLTEEEALQIVEMYADQISEHVSEHNVVELPPMRFTKESSTSGKLMMEAVVIDVSPEYFTTAPISPRVIEDDLRTDMDVDDEFSMLEEAAVSNLSPDEAAPPEILADLMEVAPPIKPPRTKHKSIEEHIEENNEPPAKRRAKKRSTDSEKEDDSLQEFERRKNLNKLPGEHVHRRRTESELEDDSLYEFENRKNKEEFKSCHEDLGKCSPETGVAQTSENESMYSAIKTLDVASIDSKKSLTEDEGTFDTAEDSAFDKSEISALESLAQSLHEIQRNLTVVASDSSGEMHSAQDLLESIAQPLSDVQKSIELVEAKMNDLPAGHCSSEVLQTLVEPITELQKNFALLERKSLPSILASVSGPLQELNREMTLIQQAAYAQTEEHYTKSVEEVQETLTKIIERQQTVPSDTKIHDKLSYELHKLEEKANDELETYYDKLLTLATDFRRRASVEDNQEIVDILKCVGDLIRPLKHLTAITSKCIAVIVEDNQLGIIPSTKVVDFLLKPLEALKTSLILLENVNMLRSHKAIRGAGIPVLYKVSVPMDELETTIKLVENLSAHTAVEFLVPPLENLMKIVSEIDITSGGEGFLENLPNQGAPIVRKLDNSLAVILHCIEAIEKGVAVGDTERGLISKLPSITKPIEDLQKILRVIEKNLNSDALSYEDVYNIAQELSKPLQSIRSEFSILQHEIEADQFGNEENPEQIALTSLIQPLESVQNCISSFHETVMCKSPEDPMHIRFVLFALKELNEPFGALCSNIIKTEGAILGQGDPYRGLKILARCVMDLKDVSSSLKTDFTLVENISTMLQKPLTQVLTSLEKILQTVDKKGKETVNVDLLKQMEEPFKALQTVLLEIESGLDEPAAKEGANSEFRQAVRELRRSILVMQDQSSFEYGDEPSTIESNIETLQSLTQPLQVLKGRFTEIQRTSNKALIKADKALTSLRDSARRVSATISEFKIQKLGSEPLLNIIKSLGTTIDKLENSVDDTNTMLGREGKINDARLKMEDILKTASEQLGVMCLKADDLAVSLEPGKRKSLVLIQDVIHDLKAAIDQSMQLLVDGGKGTITERNKSTLIAIEQLSAAMTSFHGQLNELDEFTLSGSLPRGVDALKQYIDTLANNLKHILATHNFDKNDQIILELVSNDVKSVQRVVDNLAQEGAADSARVRFVLAKVESMEEDLKDIAKGMESGDVMKKACQIALTVINIGEELLTPKTESKIETLATEQEPEVCVIGEILESVDCLESSFGKLKKSGRLADTVSETALADVSLEITMLLGMAEDLATGATGELLDKAHKICSPIKDIEEKIIHALEITNPEVEEMAEKLQEINKSLITAIKLSEKSEQEKEFEKLFSYDTLISSVDIPIIKSIVSSIGFMQTQLPTFTANLNPRKEKLIQFLDNFESNLVKFGECVTSRQDEDELMDYLTNMRIELCKVQEGNMKPIQQLLQVVESLKDCVHPGGLSQILPELQAVLTPLRQLHEQLSRSNKIQNVTEQEVKYIEQFNEASNDLEISLVQLEKAAVTSGKMETDSLSQIIERLVNYVREIEVDIPVQDVEKDESILRPIMQPILEMQHTVHELEEACQKHEKAKSVDILQSIAKPIRDLRTNVAIIYDQIMISHSPCQLDELREAVALATSQTPTQCYTLKRPLVQLQARLDELEAASELDEIVSEITGPVEELKKAMEILESEGEQSPLMHLCHQVVDFVTKSADDTLSEMSSIGHASKALALDTDPLLCAATLRHSLQEEQSLSDFSASSDTLTKAQEIEHITESRAATIDQQTAINEAKCFEVSSVLSDVASVKESSTRETCKVTDGATIIQCKNVEKVVGIQSKLQPLVNEKKVSEKTLNEPEDTEGEFRTRSSLKEKETTENEQRKHIEVKEKVSKSVELIPEIINQEKEGRESLAMLTDSKSENIRQTETQEDFENTKTGSKEKQEKHSEASKETTEPTKKEERNDNSSRIEGKKDDNKIKKTDKPTEDLNKTVETIIREEAHASAKKQVETEKEVLQKGDFTTAALDIDLVIGKASSKEPVSSDLKNITNQEEIIEPSKIVELPSENVIDKKVDNFLLEEKSNLLGKSEKSVKSDPKLELKMPTTSGSEEQMINNLEQFNKGIEELERGLLQLQKAIATSGNMEVGFLAEVGRMMSFIDSKIHEATDESKSLQPLFQPIMEIQDSIAEIKEASEKGEREKAANVVQNMARPIRELRLNFAMVCHEGVLNQSASELEELKEALTLMASQTPEKCETLKHPLVQLQAKLEQLGGASEFDEVVAEISDSVNDLKKAVETLESEGEQSILLKLCHQVVDIITKSSDNTLSEISSVSQYSKALAKESEPLLNAASLCYNLHEDQTFSDISEASESVTYAKEMVHIRPTASVTTEEQIAVNEASKLSITSVSPEVALVKDASLGLILATSKDVTVISPERETITIAKGGEKKQDRTGEETNKLIDVENTNKHEKSGISEFNFEEESTGKQKEITHLNIDTKQNKDTLAKEEAKVEKDEELRVLDEGKAMIKQKEALIKEEAVFTEIKEDKSHVEEKLIHKQKEAPPIDKGVKKQDSLNKQDSEHEVDTKLKPTVEEKTVKKLKERTFTDTEPKVKKDSSFKDIIHSVKDDEIKPTIEEIEVRQEKEKSPPGKDIQRKHVLLKEISKPGEDKEAKPSVEEKESQKDTFTTDKQAKKKDIPLTEHEKEKQIKTTVEEEAVEKQEEISPPTKDIKKKDKEEAELTKAKAAAAEEKTSKKQRDIISPVNDAKKEEFLTEQETKRTQNSATKPDIEENVIKTTNEATPLVEEAKKKDSLVKEETKLVEDKPIKPAVGEKAAEIQKQMYPVGKGATKKDTLLKEETTIEKQKHLRSNIEEESAKNTKQTSPAAKDYKENNSLLKEKTKQEDDETDKPALEDKASTKQKQTSSTDKDIKKRESLLKEETILEGKQKVKDAKKKDTVLEEKAMGGDKGTKESVEEKTAEKQKEISSAKDAMKKDSPVKEESKTREDKEIKPTVENKTGEKQKETSPAAKDAKKKDSPVKEEYKVVEAKEVATTIDEKTAEKQKETSPPAKVAKKKDSIVKEEITKKPKETTPTSKDAKKKDSFAAIQSESKENEEVKPSVEEKTAKTQKETTPTVIVTKRQDSLVKIKTEEREAKPSVEEKTAKKQKETYPPATDVKKKDSLGKEDSKQTEDKEAKPSVEEKTAKKQKETSPPGKDVKKKDSLVKEDSKETEDKEAKPSVEEKTAKKQKETSPPAKDVKKKDSLVKEDSKKTDDKEARPSIEEKTAKKQKEISPPGKDVKKKDSLVKEDSKKTEDKEARPSVEEKPAKKQKETSPPAKKDSLVKEDSKKTEDKEARPSVEEKTAKKQKETSPPGKHVKKKDSLVKEDSKQTEDKEAKPSVEEKTAKKQKETSPPGKDVKKKDSLVKEDSKKTEDKEAKPSVEEKTAKKQKETSPPGKDVKKKDSLVKEDSKETEDKEAKPSVEEKTAKKQKETSPPAKDVKKKDSLVKEDSKKTEDKEARPSVEEKTAKKQKEISPPGKDVKKKDSLVKEDPKGEEHKAVKYAEGKAAIKENDVYNFGNEVKEEDSIIKEESKLSEGKLINRSLGDKTSAVGKGTFSDHLAEEKLNTDITISGTGRKREILEPAVKAKGDIKLKHKVEISDDIIKDVAKQDKMKLLNSRQFELFDGMNNLRVETESGQNNDFVEKADNEIKTEYLATVSTKTTTAEDRMRAITVVELPDYHVQADNIDYTRRVPSSTDLKRYHHIPPSSPQDFAMYKWDRSKEISWRHLEFPIDDYERPQTYYRPRRSISPGPELHSLTHLPASLYSSQNIHKSRRSASPLQLSKHSYSTCSLNNLVSNSRRHFDELHSLRFRPPTPTKLFSPISRTKSGRIEHYERRAYICNGLVDKTVTHGGKIRLTCNIGGDPEPRIEWLKDGTAISLHTDPDRYTTALDYGVASIEINDAMSSDAGQYTCVIKNPNGQTSATTATVRIAMPQSDSEDDSEEKTWENVDDDLETDSLPKEICLSVKGPDIGMPRVTGLIADPVVPSGGTIALHVQVSGCTKPDVTWMREGTPIPRVAPRVHYLEDGGLFTLLLEGATPAESGVYTCRVSGGSGRWKGLVDTTTTIQVVERRAHEKPALFTVKPQSRMVLSSGEDMTLTCYISGEPRPRVSLMKGIKDITNSCRTLKESFGEYVRLTLKRITRDDSGTFFIQARNVYGTDRSFVTLQVQDRSRSMSPPIRWFDRHDAYPSFREIHYNAYRSASTLTGTSLFYG